MIVMITGATSGFGKACAEKFAASGHHLILTGRRKDRLKEICSSLEDRFGITALPLLFDVRDQQAVFEAVENLSPEWRAIDVLVNNAGLALGRDYFDEAQVEDWNIMIDTNVKGFLYVAKAVSALMIARGKGHIINLGSISGKEVYEKGNVYCATKFAVDALNQGMRIDLLRHGIKVTAVNPGAADTEFSSIRFKGDESAARKVYEGIEPLTAEDVADTVHYCTTLPPHVCINDITMTCLRQANSFYVDRKL